MSVEVVVACFKTVPWQMQRVLRRAVM